MIETVIQGIPLQFETSGTVFSPSHVDTGTLAMLSQAEFPEDGRVLDLGCGYGVVGIYAAKLVGAENVILTDVSEEAVRLAAENAERNGVGALSVRQGSAYESVPESGFSLILSNPPYHTDFSVPKEFIETGYHKLREGGRLLLVTKRLEWYRNKMASVFGGVRVTERDGYYVFLSEKRPRGPKPQKQKTAGQLSRKLRRKYGK